MEPENSPDPPKRQGDIHVSLGIIAWNEEEAIGPALESVLGQTLFADLATRGLRCELFCVANGCTDRTAEVALTVFKRQTLNHPHAATVLFHVAELKQRGKYNAWNEFVHRLSAPDAQYLFLLDADILIHEPDTLRSMLSTLEEHPEATVAVDQPCKDICFKPEKSARDRLSVGASQLTLAVPAQLCGQLYCIRAAVARKLYLPKDLAACEDGFIKAMVCTDLAQHEILPERIRLAPRAAHTFEAYTSPRAILKNQKRQVIGQTMVHVLVDHYIKGLPAADQLNLAEALRRQDQNDPGWLKRMVGQHVRRMRWPWRLYPGLLNQRFKGLHGARGAQRIAALPAAIAGAALTLAASFSARRFLVRGGTEYWPKAQRAGLAERPLPKTLQPATLTNGRN